MKAWIRTLRGALSAGESPEDVLPEWLERQADGSALLGLPWSADAERLRYWLLENLDAGAPPASAEQLWFRMHANTWGGRVDSCDLELHGGTESDDYLEPIARETWRVETLHAGSLVLPRLACAPDLGPERGEVACLMFAALAVARAIDGVDERLLLGSLPARGVTVGYASGPGAFLGTFTEDGWDDSELHVLERDA